MPSSHEVPRRQDALQRHFAASSLGGLASIDMRCRREQILLAWLDLQPQVSAAYAGPASVTALCGGDFNCKQTPD